MTTVAVVALGEMGACLAQRLVAGGARVVTALEGRSAATQRRAAESGVEDLALPAAVAAADVFISVLPPARAVELAQRVAPLAHANLIYVDANAVSPRTALTVQGIVEAAGARFVDGGIIGVPPDPTVYLSGPSAAGAAGLLAGVRVRLLGTEAGRASALKMCYAAFTKGSTALATELLVAAHRLGVGEELDAELQESAPELHRLAAGRVPGMTPKAHRWIAEMEEIAVTFAGVGLTPLMLLGAAEIYRLVEAAGGADARGGSLAETIERISGGDQEPASR